MRLTCRQMRMKQSLGLVRAWAGGVNGRQVIDRFISQAPLHLNAYGRILLMQSTLADVEETIRKFEESQP